MPAIRYARFDDLAALTAIYNHYIIQTPITFDVLPYETEQRRQWFDDHQGGRHRLLVAEEGASVVGYATTSRWRPKAAYDTTVEATVYVRHDAVGRGIGRALYAALFNALANEDIRAVVAGIALPNNASVALHERFGFHRVGVFTEVGRKFDRFWDVAWFQKTVHK